MSVLDNNYEPKISTTFLSAEVGIDFLLLTDEDEKRYSRYIQTQINGYECVAGFSMNRKTYVRTVLRAVRSVLDDVHLCSMIGDALTIDGWYEGYQFKLIAYRFYHEYSQPPF